MKGGGFWISPCKTIFHPSNMEEMHMQLITCDQSNLIIL